MSSIISKHDKWTTVGIIIAVIVGSMLVLAMVSVVYGFALGYDLQNIMAFLADLEDAGNRNKTRIFLLLNHLFTFIIPALLVGIIVTRKQAKEYLGLTKSPIWRNIALGVLIVMVAYPFIQKSYEWNSMLPLPDWMIALENDTNESLRGLLTMDHLGEFLINVFVIAVIPGIGEELLFRGVIQKESYRWFKHPVIAVWIAAILFSAMHMQFQGFFPRLLLGTLLGYLYLWTKNLWIPIIVHFLNNAIPIIAMYFFQTDIADLSPEESPDIPFLLAIGSLLLTIGVGMYIISKNQPEDVPSEIA